MPEDEFRDLVAGYNGAKQLQYGNIEERLKLLDAVVVKNYAKLTGNQVDVLVRAQREARRHLNHIKGLEAKAEERRRRAEEDRNARE